MNRSLVRIALAFVLALVAVAVNAQGFPSRPIKILVGVPAGGTIDAVARLMAERMAEEFKVPVIVDNRPGAGGAIAIDAMAVSEPDGYTLMVAFPTLTALPFVSKSFKRDLLSEFKPIAAFARTPFVLFVGPKLPVTSVTELVAVASRSPGSITFGSADGSTRLATELFASIAGIELRHIPYRGGAPMIADIAGGQVDLGFLGVPSVLGMHKSGRVRVLAAANDRRIGALAEVPTLEEAGIKGFTFHPWVGLVGPDKLPPAVLAKIESALRGASEQAAVVGKLRDMGTEPGFLDATGFAEMLVRERALFKKVAVRANIVPE